MKRQNLLKIINLILLLDFILIASTAILHELIIPTGLYGLLHALPGFLFVILIIFHLILNKAWLKNTYLHK